MTLFAGTAENYRQHRSNVPESVTTVLLAAVSEVVVDRRLLDLGTGTGFVVQALMDHFDDVIAVDPDPDLLAVAQSDLSHRGEGRSHVRFVESSAEDFQAPTGWQPHLVTVCRAFHWMDQAAVLQRLEACVAPDGVVAIFGDGSVWTSTTPWKVEMRRLVQEFLGQDRRAGTGTFTHHDRPYRDILAESAFSVIDEYQLPLLRTRTIDSVIGYLHSTSFAAPGLFGSRLKAFDEEARSRLIPYLSEQGLVDDDNEFQVLVARCR